MKLSITVFSILTFYTNLHSLHAETSSKNLEELYTSGKVSLDFQSIGGHQNQCMQLVIANNTADSILGMVEAGRRLNSLNETEQDILIVKSAKFALAAKQKDTLMLTGFCCQSKKSSPSSGSLFAIGSMASAAWLIITNLIDRNNFPADAIQHAIWVLSDNHDIRSIPAYKAPAMDQLRYAVAEILDIELPWYSFRYKGDSTDLFTGTKTHLFADVPFEIPQRAMITPQVTKPTGEIIFTGESTYFSAGENVIRVQIPIEQWDVTAYDLHLMEDFHTTNKKLRFTLLDE